MRPDQTIPDILNTGIKNSRNVLRYTFGEGRLTMLADLLDEKRKSDQDYVIYLVDQFFCNEKEFISLMSVEKVDKLIFVETEDEPTTTYVNRLCRQIVDEGKSAPCAIVGVGGGITLDVAKAISNLLTNGGKAEDYQGWDLVQKPGVYKIGVPTLSGTGAEATRTCVMTNEANGLKLGMNSDHTVFDQLILDPNLTRTVPRSQYFFTGMDAYIHCLETLNGGFRNAIGDVFSEQVIQLCRDVFFDDDMMSDESRQKMMVASYLGGCAIATSYVGVVHPFSAALSVVLGLHHCVANCIVLGAMEEFYPKGYEEFSEMTVQQNVSIPAEVCSSLTDKQHDDLFDAMIVHEKPLTNALGVKFKEILTRDKARELFETM